MPGRGRDRGYKGPKKKVATPMLSSQPDARRGRGYQPAAVNDARRGRGYKPATLAPMKDERAEALAAAQPPPLNRPTMYTRFGVAPAAPLYGFGLENVRRVQTPRSGKGYQGQTVFNRDYPLLTPTGTPHDTGVSQPSLSARHGWHMQTMLRNIQPGGVTGVIPEAQGMLASPPPEVPTEPYVENGGYGYGYGGYGGGGGGGGDYTYPTYSNPFSQYQQSYPVQGIPAPQAPTFRTAGQANPYKPYATQNQAQRWISMLTNWRI